MTPSRWLRTQSRLAGHDLHIATALQLTLGVLIVFQAWILASVIDAVAFGDAGLDGVDHWLWWLLAIMAARAAVVWSVEHFAARGAARIRTGLRERVFRHLQTLGTARLQNAPSGSLLESLTRGIDDLDGYYARFLPARMLAMALPLGICLLVLPLDWLSGLVIAFTAPLIPLFMILIGKGAESVNRRLWLTLKRMGGRFLDAIQGLSTLKLFGAGQRESESLARDSESYRRGTMDVLRVAFLSSAVLEFFASVSIAIIAVFIGFRLYRLELPVPDWMGVPEIGFVHGFFILLLAPEVYLPLRNLGTHYHAKLQAAAAAEGLIEILDTRPERQPAARQDRQETRGQPGLAPRIRLDGVSFEYEPDQSVIQGLDLEIRPGERIAVVGPSGAGKTTLTRLLLALIGPTRGSILVDGRDLAGMDRSDWHRLLAWVPQSPRLFQGSIASNIGLGLDEGDPRLARPAMRDAARLARADVFIDALPAGYETRVGELGVGLSGGERQRIALARAFLRKAPVIILDEPTASLDPESEALVQGAIDDLAQGRTLITVAHRLSTVERSDRILVLDGGRLVAHGDHGSLMSEGGLYRTLVESSSPGAGLLQ